CRRPRDDADRLRGPEDAAHARETRDVLATHDGEESGTEIRLAERDQDLARPGDRQPRHGEVRAPRLEGGDDVAEIRLDEVERPAKRRRELAREVDLETDQPTLLPEGVGWTVTGHGDAERRCGRGRGVLRRAGRECSHAEAYDEILQSHGGVSSHINRRRVHPKPPGIGPEAAERGAEWQDGGAHRWVRDLEEATNCEPR